MRILEILLILRYRPTFFLKVNENQKVAITKIKSVHPIVGNIITNIVIIGKKNIEHNLKIYSFG